MLVQHYIAEGLWKSFVIAGEGSTYSTGPQLTPDNGTTEVFTQGPSHTLWQYWTTSNGWGNSQITGENEVYSNPILQVINGTTELFVQGPNHTLVQHWVSPEGWATFTIANNAFA